MWVAKVKFSEKETLIGSKAEKYNVNLFGFPLSYYYEKNWVVVHITGTMFGEEKNKEKFVQELRREKRLIGLEINNDFIIGTIKEPIYAKTIYNKDLIYLAPVLISDKGYELLIIGSFNKKPLMKAIDSIERKLGGELLSIQQKKIKSISVMKMHPDLTDKQKHAMKLAIEYGYYHSPRKTSIQKLARIAGLSFSTFQVHLRKAEEKLIPYFFE